MSAKNPRGKPVGYVHPTKPVIVIGCPICKGVRRRGRACFNCRGAGTIFRHYPALSSVASREHAAAAGVGQ